MAQATAMDRQTDFTGSATAPASPRHDRSQRGAVSDDATAATAPGESRAAGPGARRAIARTAYS